MSTDDHNISSLYRETGGPEPPRALDDAILSASRTAVEQRHAAGSPFSGAWPAAASIAAVIVITVLLVPILKQEDSQPPASEPVQRATAPAEPEVAAPPAAGLSSVARKKSSDAAPSASAPSMLLQEGPISAFQTAPTAVSSDSSMELLHDANEMSYFEEEEAPSGPDASEHKRSRMQAADSAPFAINTPEMWEARIKQLIAQGEMEQARAELDRLKEHYPDYSINPSIPEELK